MGYPLEKLFEFCFFSGVVVRPPTFWEMGHFENSKRMELRKGKKKTKERNRKGETDFGKQHVKKNWTQQRTPQHTYY